MDNDTKIGCILIILGLFVAIAYGLISTKIEQNTFNKYSKTKATFVEALFTELRVIPN